MADPSMLARRLGFLGPSPTYPLLAVMLCMKTIRYTFIQLPDMVWRHTVVHSFRLAFFCCLVGSTRRIAFDAWSRSAKQTQSP
jgi:hypothetical protein